SSLICTADSDKRLPQILFSLITLKKLLPETQVSPHGRLTPPKQQNRPSLYTKPHLRTFTDRKKETNSNQHIITELSNIPNSKAPSPAYTHSPAPDYEISDGRSTR